ncbi:MAG: type II toxin-antitoxin system VapC family toxin [Acidobacteriaceae bacterium]
MTTYADTSVLVSLYLTDRNSEEARRRVAEYSPLWLTPLHIAEWTHAIAQHVFRGNLSAAEAKQFVAHFARDRSGVAFNEAALPDQAFEACTLLGRRHTARLGTRTLDTLHVACALELKAERFWTFDERQRKLARAAGLRIA